MKLTEIPPRTRFKWLYGPTLAVSLGVTVAVLSGFDFLVLFVTAQSFLVYVTGLGLISTVEGSAPLTRFQALFVLVVSASANIFCHAFFHQDASVIIATANKTPLELNDYIYFSIVTFTTLGFGDLQPIPEARLVAAFQALNGYLYLGLFIGVVTGGFRPAVNGAASEKVPGENG